MAESFVQIESGKGVSAAFRRRSSITLERVEVLLATADSVRDVSTDAVRSVCSERGIDLASSLVRGRKALYGRYLKYCLDDKVLSPEENEDLTHIRQILQLSREDVLDVHDAVSIEVYGEAVREVLADFHLDEEEAQFLQRLREDLELPEERADQIFKTESFGARNRALSRASTSDPTFARHRSPAARFTGRSSESLEHAINDAIAKATLAIPKLHWFEVSETAGYVEDGSASGWHVTIQAGIRTEERD